jgi:hypothetical protein
MTMSSGFNIDWRYTTVTQAGQHSLGKQIRGSLEDFFKHFPEAVDVSVVAYSVGPGGNAQQLVRRNTTLKRRLRIEKTPGVPVSIFTNGTQCVEALLTVPGKNDDDLEKIIEGGLYRRKPKSLERVSLVDVALAAAGPSGPPVTHIPPQGAVLQEAGCDEGAHGENVTETSPKVLTIAGDKPKETRSPREIFLERGVPHDEIAKLKETLSALLFDAFNGATIDPQKDNLVLISVEKISEAALRYMGLPKNKRDNYQGIIGSFYSTRLSLFGQKHETSSDPSAQYTDWMIDCRLVLDFVGGNDSLAALARVYKTRIEAIEQSEAKADSRPTPSVEEIADVVENGFTQDAEVLAMVANLMAEHSRDLEAVVAAEQNAEAALQQVRDAERVLMNARIRAAQAKDLVKQAEEKAAKTRIPDDLLTKIKEIRDRFSKFFDSVLETKMQK